jgi:hypothetical protein
MEKLSSKGILFPVPTYKLPSATISKIPYDTILPFLTSISFPFNVSFPRTTRYDKFYIIISPFDII